MKLILPDALDTATIAATPSWLPTMPIDNMLGTIRGGRSRTPSAGSFSITLTWPLLVQLGGLAMTDHNLTPSAQWRLRLYADNFLTTLVYDSGTIAVSRPKRLDELAWGREPLGATIYTGWAQKVGVLWFGPLLAAGAVLDIEDSGNPDGYLQARRLFLGPVVEFEQEWGIKLGWATNSKQTRLDGGALATEVKSTYRSINADLRLMPAQAASTLREIARTVGISREVFVSAYPQWSLGTTLERDAQCAMQFTQIPTMSHQHPSRFDSSFQLEEAL